MKLYRKRLNDVGELHREKQMLQRKLKQADNEDFFSFSGSSAQSAKTKKVKEQVADQPQESTGNDIADYISAFSGMIGSGSFSQGLMAALPLAVRMVPGHKVKKVLGKAAKEFIGGYIKWKAIEVGYRLAKRYVVARRQKQQAQQKQKQR